MTVTIRAVTGTTDTPTTSDDGDLVTFDNASDCAVTLQNDSNGGWSAGTVIHLSDQLNTGNALVTPESPATLNGGTGAVTVGGSATLVRVAANEWVMEPRTLPFTHDIGWNTSPFTDAGGVPFCYSEDRSAGTMSQQAGADNYMFGPYIVPLYDIVIEQQRIIVSTADAGASNLYFGVTLCDDDGFPATSGKVGDENFDPTTTGEQAGGALSWTLSAGEIYLPFWLCDSATVAVGYGLWVSTVMPVGEVDTVMSRLYTSSDTHTTAPGVTIPDPTDWSTWNNGSGVFWPCVYQWKAA